LLAWHVTQANPAPNVGWAGGELVEYVGWEIIRRWRRTVEPELWRDQGRDCYRNELRRLGAWHDGVLTQYRHRRD